MILISDSFRSTCMRGSRNFSKGILLGLSIKPVSGSEYRRFRASMRLRKQPRIFSRKSSRSNSGSAIARPVVSSIRVISLSQSASKSRKAFVASAFVNPNEMWALRTNSSRSRTPLLSVSISSKAFVKLPLNFTSRRCRRSSSIKSGETAATAAMTSSSDTRPSASLHTLARTARCSLGSWMLTTRRAMASSSRDSRRFRAKSVPSSMAAMAWVIER
mmetsp:Transcript_88188/g.269846  ORF Transcript_88188/g.269846 Transcript_88188/m.269846 type:complete len:217 (-) Transcript_88188:21-671(-)